jgi:hypothetical protein
MARQLWDVFDGEPFLDNPNGPGLFILNGKKSSKKGKKKMARKRNRKGQFVRKNAPKKHKAKAAPRRAVAAAPKRRRTRRKHVPLRSHSIRVRGPVQVNRRHRRRRSYGINPSLGSLMSMGTLKTVGYTAGGFIGVPFIEAYINTMIPKVADPTLAKVLRYAVKIGTAWALSFGVGKVAGKDAGQKVLIGGLANVALTAASDFGLLGTKTTTAAAPATGRYLSSQPLLGAYPGMGSLVTTRTADRLNPANRF